jgi:Protein of unknown function (DUF3040)
MLSKEDQRRFEQITRNLRTTDPDFVARISDRAWTRRSRLLVLFSILLTAAVPPLAVVGGYAAGVVSTVLLTVAGVMLALSRRT